MRSERGLPLLSGLLTLLLLSPQGVIATRVLMAKAVAQGSALATNGATATTTGVATAAGNNVATTESNAVANGAGNTATSTGVATATDTSANKGGIPNWANSNSDAIAQGYKANANSKATAIAAGQLSFSEANSLAAATGFKAPDAAPNDTPVTATSEALSDVSGQAGPGGEASAGIANSAADVVGERMSTANSSAFVTVRAPTGVGRASATSLARGRGWYTQSTARSGSIVDGTGNAHAQAFSDADGAANDATAISSAALIGKSGGTALSDARAESLNDIDHSEFDFLVKYLPLNPTGGNSVGAESKVTVLDDTGNGGVASGYSDAVAVGTENQAFSSSEATTIGSGVSGAISMAVDLGLSEKDSPRFSKSNAVATVADNTYSLADSVALSYGTVNNVGVVSTALAKGNSRASTNVLGAAIGGPHDVSIAGATDAQDGSQAEYDAKAIAYTNPAQLVDLAKATALIYDHRLPVNVADPVQQAIETVASAGYANWELAKALPIPYQG